MLSVLRVSVHGIASCDAEIFFLKKAIWIVGVKNDIVRTLSG
jgi:hypothetical protein